MLFLSLFFFKLSTATVDAEALLYDYTYGLAGDSDYDETESMVTDSEGNVYIVGYFNGSNLDFDPTDQINLLSESGSFGGYLTKINADGTYGYTYAWTDAYPRGVAVDSDNNIYLTINISANNVDLDPTSGTDIHTLVGSYNAGILRINADGSYHSTTIVEDGDTTIIGIHITQDNTIYYAGYISGTNIDLDPTSGTDIFSSVGSNDGFVTKLNSDLTYGYSYKVGGTAFDFVWDVAVDDEGNLYYITNSTSSNVDFNPTAGTDTKSSDGDYDFYITKISEGGVYQFTYRIGGTDFDRAYDLNIDANNDVYLLGYFSSASVDFDPTAGTDVKALARDYSGFVVKIASDGSYEYSIVLPELANDAWIYDLEFDEVNNFYISGGFYDTVDFDSSSGTTNKTSAGDSDAYIAKYTSEGELLSVHTWGGSGYDDVFPGGLTLFENKVYVLTYSSGTSFNADPTGGTATISTNGNGQSFLTLLTIDDESPSVSLTTTLENTSNKTPSIRGTASDPGSLGLVQSVEFQVDGTSGTWAVCTADDGAFDESSEAFTCTVNTQLSEGNHRIYLRTRDNHDNTTTSSYTSNGFLIDLSKPLRNDVTITIGGKEYKKSFAQVSIPDLSSVGDNEFPQFCFSKAYDTDGGAGINYYDVIVDDKKYLRNISYSAPNVGGNVRQDGDHAVIKETDEYWYRYVNDDRPSETQEVCVYGKKDSHKLSSGLHTWKVRATDKAGNSVDTNESRFLVKTNLVTATSNQWFPVAVLKIGNKMFTQQFSTLSSSLFDPTKPVVITTPNPTFFGIANSGSKVTLILDKEYIDAATQSKKREQVTTQHTTVNELSQWGVNLTKEIATLQPAISGEKPTYFITIMVEKDSNLAIIKDIPIQLDR